MGISSTKRRGSGTVELNGGWKIFYSGVGLLVSPNIAECVVDWVPLGEKVCLPKVKAAGAICVCRAGVRTTVLWISQGLDK